MLQAYSFLLSILRRIVTGYGVETGLQYPSLRRYLPSPSSFNTCACSVAFDCPDPSWSGGQFICQYGNNCTKGSIVWSVPGLSKACNILEELFKTDLRCLFDQSCINMILSLYNVDMPSRLPLPAITYNMTALNSSIPSRFSPNDSIGTILDHLAVEEWKIETTFETYYNTCAPTKCTYTIEQRMDIIYTVSTVVSFFGGLTVVFRLLTPIIVALIHSILTHGLTQQHFTREVLARNTTGLLTRLDEKTILETMPSPSLAMVEKLRDRYSTSLSCPCEKITIPYKQFLTVQHLHHQVCSSSLTKHPFTTILYGYGDSKYDQMRFDRPLLSRQLQILGWICEEAQNMMKTVLSVLEETNFISASVLSKTVFITEIEHDVDKLIQRHVQNFELVFNFTTTMFQVSMLPSAFDNDWLFEYGNETNGYLVRSTPRTFKNSSCNCAVSSECQEPIRIGPPNLILPGLVKGCSPVDGMRLSTLECFFSSECIATILAHIDYFDVSNDSTSSDFIPLIELSSSTLQLNHSTISRFSANALISSLVSALFVEQLNTTISYENYFVSCAPSACQYQYDVKNDIIYVTTSILGFYGGLTVSLRFIIWNGVRFFFWQRSFRRVFHTSVESIS